MAGTSGALCPHRPRHCAACRSPASPIRDRAFPLDVESSDEVTSRLSVAGCKLHADGDAAMQDLEGLVESNAPAPDDGTVWKTGYFQT